MKYSLLLKIMCVSTSFCMLQAAALGGAGDGRSDGTGDGGALPSSRSASDEEDRPATRVVHAAAVVSDTVATPSLPYVPRVIKLPPYTTWTSPEEFERYFEGEVLSKSLERVVLQEIPEMVRAYYQMVLEEYKRHAGKVDPDGSEMIRYMADFSRAREASIQDFINGKANFYLPGDLQHYIFNTETYTPLSDLYDMLKARKQERDEEDYTVLYAKWCRFVKRVNSLFSATSTPHGYRPLSSAAAVPPMDDDATDEVTAGAGAAGAGESKKNR